MCSSSNANEEDMHRRATKKLVKKIPSVKDKIPHVVSTNYSQYHILCYCSCSYFVNLLILLGLSPTNFMGLGGKKNFEKSENFFAGKNSKKIDELLEFLRIVCCGTKMKFVEHSFL